MDTVSHGSKVATRPAISKLPTGWSWSLSKRHLSQLVVLSNLLYWNGNMALGQKYLRKQNPRDTLTPEWPIRRAIDFDAHDEVIGWLVGEVCMQIAAAAQPPKNFPL